MRRCEIRTPKENLLMFVIVEKDGNLYVEVKRQHKIDYVTLEAVLQILSKYNTNIKIFYSYASYSDSKECEI